MKKINYNMKEHGFVGHLSVPDQNSKYGVVVIMGGEQSMLPGTLIADRFADYGINALAVSLFGADGLSDGVNQIPLEMFIPAIKVLKDMGCTSISTYGMSMGSIFAALIPKYIDGVDNVILCSPTHVPFEGTVDKKTNSGQSVVTWKGQDIPFVRPCFATWKAAKYYFDKEANRKVMGMWIAYRDAYRDKDLEALADFKLYETGARILLIAGTGDEAWPSDYSVNYIKNQLDAVNYQKDYKVCIYPNASHLIGMMPNRERERRIYRILPFLGLMYKSFGKYKKECMNALEVSEKEIVNWILGAGREMCPGYREKTEGKKITGNMKIRRFCIVNRAKSPYDCFQERNFGHGPLEDNINYNFGGSICTDKAVIFNLNQLTVDVCKESIYEKKSKICSLFI